MTDSRIIMVCGAGFGQLPAILSAKQLGFQVLAIDKEPNAPGMKIADFAHAIDIIAIDEAIEVARKYRISGVITLQSDVAVPTVGAIVDALNLPGSSACVAQQCTNKISSRRAFQNANIPQPKFRVVFTLEEARAAGKEVGFPCVLKAPDSSGSRGIVRANSDRDLAPALAEVRTFTRSDSLLVEEYVNGEEIGAQTFSVAGRCEVVLVHNDAMSDPPYMIPIGHSFPSKLPGHKLTAVEAAIRRCVAALGIREGPANIDIVLDQRGHPKFIEVGLRIGATCLPELVMYHTGIDWVAAAIQSAVGDPPDLTPVKSQPCAGYILQAPADGILGNVRYPSDIFENSDVLECEVTAKIGSSVSRLRKGTDRVGKVIAKGKSADEAERTAQKVLSRVQLGILPKRVASIAA